LEDDPWKCGTFPDSWRFSAILKPSGSRSASVSMRCKRQCSLRILGPVDQRSQ
jgi:hypothetical protein